MVQLLAVTPLAIRSSKTGQFTQHSLYVIA